MTPFIRTLGGDIDPSTSGPVFAHEHLIIDSPYVAEHAPQIHLPSADEAIAEVNTCIRAGVRLMVDAMPCASGRDPERLSRISILTGMRIVGATGLHTAKYYEDVPWVFEESPEELARRFISDIDEGIDAHDYLGDDPEVSEARAGVIKVAALKDSLSDQEERLFEAAAITAARTGAPILTHTEAGLGGIGQIEVLTGLGVDASRIILSHTDKVADVPYHREMLSTGATLCYDQALRSDLDEKNLTARMVASAVDSGHGGQIVLGTDGARRSLWSTLDGSPGLAWLANGFADLLRSIGVTEETLNNLYERNPARAFSFAARG